MTREGTPFHVPTRGRSTGLEHCSVYLRGLLTDGQRKSVEPMAARLGEDGNRQAL
ncbi:transposase, partial [Streptomyces mirabilis]|uniref:transposase n=1 Tax=Streptomyces mirabilis TaxID=68239 RepID=UPI00332C386A